MKKPSREIPTAGVLPDGSGYFYFATTREVDGHLVVEQELSEAHLKFLDRTLSNKKGGA